MLPNDPSKIAPTFAVFPRSLIEDHRLTGEAFRLLLLLGTSPSGVVQVEKLPHLAGRDPLDLATAFGQLTALGYLAPAPDGHWSVNWLA